MSHEDTPYAGHVTNPRFWERPEELSAVEIVNELERVLAQVERELLGTNREILVASARTRARQWLVSRSPSYRRGQMKLDLAPPAPARARRTDPQTSHQAARSLTPDRLRRSQIDVLRVLASLGPCGGCDEEIFELLPEKSQSRSGARTRRHELVELGMAIDTGKRVIRNGGGRHTVWAITDRGRQKIRAHQSTG